MMHAWVMHVACKPQHCWLPSEARIICVGGVKGVKAAEGPKGHGGEGVEGPGAGLGLGSLTAGPRPLRFSGHSPSSEHMAVEGDAPLAAIGGAVADMEAGAGGVLSARRPVLPR